MHHSWENLGILSPLAIVRLDIVLHGFLSPLDFVPLGFCPPWILSHLDIVPLGFCPHWILSPWVFVLLGFCPLGYCPMGFCPVGFCPRTNKDIHYQMMILQNISLSQTNAGQHNMEEICQSFIFIIHYPHIVCQRIVILVVSYCNPKFIACILVIL